VSPLEDTAKRFSERLQKERAEVDAIVSAHRAATGDELDPNLVHMVLGQKKQAAEREQRRQEWDAAAEAVAAMEGRAKATWRNVETWAEQDFVDHVKQDQEDDRTGGYRSVAQRCVGYSAWQLLRRWQKISGGKSWPSGINAPSHRP
jgi:hypothetical protein